MEIGQTLERLRQVIDAKEELNNQIRELDRERSDLEFTLRNYHNATGLDKVSGSGMTISFVPKMRAKWDPQKWHDIVKWAVQSGNDHIIQRRLTDKVVIDLFDSGISFPDGLTVEGYTDIRTLRT